MKIKINAIVLNDFKFGEFHKIFYFLTEEYGLIKAVAHGAQKPLSKFRSSLELFNKVELILYLSKNNNLHSIKESTLIISRLNLRENNNFLFFNYFIIELINELFKNSSANKKVYELIDNYLNNINEKNYFSIYFAIIIKTLYLSGFISDLLTCSECMSKPEKYFISDIPGFIFCENCKKNEIKRELNKGTIFILNKILISEIEEIKRIKILKSQKKEIYFIINTLLKGITGKKFKIEIII